MIIMFIVLCYMYGYSIIKLFGIEKFTQDREINIKEAIIVILPSGFLGITLNMFVIDMVGVELGRSSIWGIVLFQIVLINLLCNKKFSIKCDILFGKFIIIDIIISVLVLNLMIYAITNYPFLPDEFSHWALQSKNIFEANKIDIFINTGFEGYPAYIPLLSSAYYFLINRVQDNSIRMLSTIHLIIVSINLIYISEKKGWSKNIIKVLIILFITSMPIMRDISSSFYADIIFMCYYASAVGYFMLWYTTKGQAYFNLSILYMIGATWTKTDGMYLCIGQVLILLILYIKNKDIKLMEVLKYSVLTLVLIIGWKVYCIVHEFPTSRWGIAPNINYIGPMLKAMLQQTIGLESGGYINLLTIACVFISWKDIFDDEMLIFILILLGNIVFLGISYILLFGGEALTAASYARYMTRVIPIQLLLIARVFYKLQVKNLKEVQDI